MLGIRILVRIGRGGRRDRNESADQPLATAARLQRGPNRTQIKSRRKFFLVDLRLEKRFPSSDSSSIRLLAFVIAIQIINTREIRRQRAHLRGQSQPENDSTFHSRREPGSGRMQVHGHQLFAGTPFRCREKKTMPSSAEYSRRASTS